LQEHWGGGIGSWRQMELPHASHTGEMSPDQIRERSRERPRARLPSPELLPSSAESSRPTSLVQQPVFATAGAPRFSAQNKALKEEVENMLKGEDSDRAKASDWNRLYRECETVKHENDAMRRSLFSMQNYEETQNLINRLVEVEEENECLKADVARLSQDNTLLIQSLREHETNARYLAAERPFQTPHKMDGGLAIAASPDEMNKMKHENTQLKTSWENAHSKKSALEEQVASQQNDIANLRAVVASLKAQLPKHPKKTDSSKNAHVTLVLRTEFEKAGQEESQERAAFAAIILQDVSNAAGIPKSNLQIKEIRGGSIVVKMTVIHDENCLSPISVARDLEKQVCVCW
jgi:hypothetical protein